MLAQLGRSRSRERDYLEHVDGKMREDGVRDFLRSRGIEAAPLTVRLIAGRKQALVEQALLRGGVEAFPGSVRWVGTCARPAYGPPSSPRARTPTPCCYAAGISDLFDLTVDGGDITRLGFAGKPAPDGFLEAARRLDVEPRRAVVVEDALAGVAAGRAGDFGLVIGVARSAAARDLRSAGADVVVDDLGELAP